MNTRRISSIVALYVMLCTGTPGLAEDTMTLAYNGDPETLAAWKFVHLVTDEMFRRVNIRLTYNVLPARRASEEANNGNLDGDNARIYEYNEHFPNLLRVDEAIYTQILAAYATDPAIRLDSWKSLHDTKYHVEYLRGVVFVEMKLSEVVSPKYLSAITTRKQGIEKLAAGRTDVFIDVEGLIASLLNRDEFKDAGIKQAGVLESNQLYLYMHKKHAALLPKLKEALIQIKAEGLYDDFWRQAFGTAAPTRTKK
jgi:polar amino acid transport system substrate-binding protein